MKTQNNQEKENNKKTLQKHTLILSQEIIMHSFAF